METIRLLKKRLNASAFIVLQRRCISQDMQLASRLSRGAHDSYLVDPASSHMLVSKIKPCMSKYKLLYTVKLRMAH